MSDIDRLLGLRHPDPHSLLGLHPDDSGKGVRIRAFRPEALQVTVVPDGSRPRIPMTHVKGGLFEARVSARHPFPYHLEVQYPHGARFLQKDAYAFGPTLGELDLHLHGEGRHERLWERLGAHPLHHQGVAGVSFAVWAPNAAGVSVVGDFNGWDGRLNPMRSMGSSGIWELFVPEIAEGTRYKFEVRPAHGSPFLKADPFAFQAEHPPATASIVHRLDHYRWNDRAWLAQRSKMKAQRRPLSIYEVHLGSWRRVPEQEHRSLSYRELAAPLADYVTRLGFTHVELLPVAEHPFGGSWGYQVSSYFAPTARHGHPDDLRYFIDHLHQRGVGVIIDWVPAHFPRDDFALARFDGTALYEHDDPRLGAHPDWGTLIFNYGRNEVRNFLIASALFWIDQYHVDGLRVDAVASMLYRDYSRGAGEWIPNRFGGRENEEAIGFLRELNEVVHRRYPGAMTLAEESTSWPHVSRSPAEGGLGFDFKWNMGWMHDTLDYFSRDPVHRRYHHHQLTFGLLYAFSEHFVLPLSHDEVVHGKGSLLAKLPGDPWQRFANLRSLLAWMWGHPGKKLLFMGDEWGQNAEWNHERSLDWHQLDHFAHHGVQHLVSDLNQLYLSEPSLYELDEQPPGFRWLQADQVDINTYAFMRSAQAKARPVICVANLSPVPRERYRVGCPTAGTYLELLNTDAECYGGSGMGNHGCVEAHLTPWDGLPASLELTLPPLSVLYLAPKAP